MRVLSESSDVPFKQFTALCSFEFLEGALKKTDLYAVTVLCSLKRDRICFLTYAEGIVMHVDVEIF